MQPTLVVERINSEKWDELVPRFRDTSYRQCSSYASAAASHVGARSELTQLIDDQRLIGLADVRVKQLPMVPLGVAYSSYAPIVLQDEHSYERQFGRCLDALREEYVERRRLVLRITPALAGGLFQDIQTSCLKSRGFYRNSEQSARETFVLDLERPLEDIRSGFDPKWRSDLTRAEKAAIKIVRSVDVADFNHFERIFLDLTKKKGFMPNQDVSFFRHIQSKTPKEQKFILHLAWHDGELVAGHLGSYVGSTSVYLLGASSAKGRELRASYLLQWSAIAYSKEVGNSFYDLGGIDQQNNPDVYRFKRRLNGRHVTEVGPYELAPGVVSKHAVRLAELARNVLRRGT